MVTDIMINIASDFIMMIAVWFIGCSLKTWVTKIINEQTFEINTQLSELSAIANENKANYAQIKNKIVVLNHDIETINKRAIDLGLQLQTLKCMRTGCEKFN